MVQQLHELKRQKIVVLKGQLGVLSHLQLAVLRPELDVVRQQSLASEQGEGEGLTVCLESRRDLSRVRDKVSICFSTLPDRHILS